MSAITLVPAASHPQGGTTDPVDVSAFSTIRLTAAVTDFAQTGVLESKHSERSNWRLYLTIEDAPAVGGPWRKVKEVGLNSATPSDNFVLSGFNAFMRVSWAIRVNAVNVDGVRLDPSLTFGVTGDAQPDAVA